MEVGNKKICEKTPFVLRLCGNAYKKQKAKNYQRSGCPRQRHWFAGSADRYFEQTNQRTDLPFKKTQERRAFQARPSPDGCESTNTFKIFAEKKYQTLQFDREEVGVEKVTRHQSTN